MTYRPVIENMGLRYSPWRDPSGAVLTVTNVTYTIDGCPASARFPWFLGPVEALAELRSYDQYRRPPRPGGRQ